jgi:hypothetical protein
MTDFSVRCFMYDIFHGKWDCGWDDRKPLPGWGGAVYVWYDGPHYALRIWRFYITLDY